MDKSLPVLKNNIQVVDLIRSLAIFSVLAGHLADALSKPYVPDNMLWDWVTCNSVGGVMMFLVVSGFLITRIIDMGPGGLFRPSWKNFYVRRVARIIPLYLLHIFGGLIFLFSMIYFFGDISPFLMHCFKLPRSEFSQTFWLSLFTFSFNWAEAFKYDQWQQIGIYWGLLWSLAVEEQFYIFYPFYLRILGNTKRLVLALIVLVMVCLLGQFPFPHDWPSTARVAVQVNIISYGEIGIGVLLYLACKQFGVQLLLRKKLNLLLCVMGASLIVFSYCPYYFGFGKEKSLMIGAGVFLFLLGAIHLKMFESKFLKIFAVPGKYSYASYLFHIIFLYLIVPSMRYSDPFLILAFYVAVTVTFAFVSYRVFELPINNLIRGWFRIGLKNKEI